MATDHNVQHRQRRLLGLRRAPGRLALAAFRIPLWLYRHDRGWMLGRTFLMFEHIGRKTGRSHQAIAMVLADNRATGEVVICSAWGPHADWVLNLRARPAPQVQVGRDRFVPDQRFITGQEASDIGVAFRRHHPRRLWLLSTILGWGDLNDDVALDKFVEAHPLIAFRPNAPC
jgi:deazaflavin-dependent oxidoreductase (nitroreductase family)